MVIFHSNVKLAEGKDRSTLTSKPAMTAFYVTILAGSAGWYCINKPCMIGEATSEGRNGSEVGFQCCYIYIWYIYIWYIYIYIFIYDIYIYVYVHLDLY